MNETKLCQKVLELFANSAGRFDALCPCLLVFLEGIHMAPTIDEYIWVNHGKTRHKDIQGQMHIGFGEIHSPFMHTQNVQCQEVGA